MWCRVACKGCPIKNAKFELRAVVALLGWRHWKLNICHLFVLRLVVMERYTKEQRLLMVQTHYKYGECYAETVRKLRGLHGHQHATTILKIQNYIHQGIKSRFVSRGTVYHFTVPNPLSLCHLCKNFQFKTQETIMLLLFCVGVKHRWCWGEQFGPKTVQDESAQ
jgi:hypothetical protein